jgi:putative ABC transport system permease protein
MSILTRVFFESVLQAWDQLVSNRLRTFLSLLGVTIGIFCIIGVQAAVNSLQDNVMDSLNKLGDDVIYIQKMPWNEDPGQNFWKYQRRPNPDYDDYQAIKTKSKAAGLVDYHVFIGARTAKYRSNSVERVFVAAVTFDFDKLFNIEFEKGRYYTPSEYHYGMNKILIGHQVASELFGSLDPIGKVINLGGRDLEVIGVFEKSGKDLLKVMDYDQAIIMSYELAKKIANVRTTNFWGTTVNVKAKPGVSLEELRDDLTWVLRSERRIKPKEDNNFSLNSLSILAKLMDNVFGVLNMVGFAIGIFAILVGMFSVANIMFVSVKERTNIIGIKKALGARQSIILLEFLIESVFLCVMGGLIGLALVYFVLLGLNDILPFQIYLDLSNMVSGLLISIVVGVLSGVIPALQASRMDPVVAIRHTA